MKLGKKSLVLFLSLIVFSIGFASKAEASVVNESITDKVSGVTTIAVVPAPDGSGNSKTYTSSAVGLREALYDIYQNGTGEDFAIYFGAALNVSTSGIFDDTIPVAPDASNMTFKALEGKVGTVVLVSAPTDNLTTNTGAATSAKLVTFAANSYFGTNVILRNITYAGTNIYMNGYDLSLNGNSHSAALKNIYGGSLASDVTGSPTITVNSTGAGNWTFYGGNSTGGTLTGNVKMDINNATSSITTVSGGGKAGAVNGSIDVTIGTSQTITNYYGGGDAGSVTGDVTTTVNNSGTITNYYGGTNSGTVVGNVTNSVENGGTIANFNGGGNSGNVDGNVTSTIDSTSTGFRLTRYVGASVSGNVTGTVTNTLKGNGGWTGTGQNFIGGSKSGNIGTDRDKDAIVTNFDTSKFSTGVAYFIGANENSGTITGKIKSVVRAGAEGNGSIRQLNGAGGQDIEQLTHANLGSSTTITGNNNNTFAYDTQSKEDRANTAKNNAKFKVFGDISTEVLGGCVSNAVDNTGYLRGAGWGGYIEGNVYTSVGTLNADGSTGGEGFVYGTAITTAQLNQALTSSLPYNYVTNRTEGAGGARFDIVGGGGSNAVWSPEIFVQGNTDLHLNNVLARWTYGGGFSGVYQGDTSITLNGGIVSTLEGSGYCDLRQYGNPKAVVKGGQIDWFLSGGGWWDNRVYGNPSVEVYGGTINASMGGTYGYTTNHRIYGDTNMIIYGGDFGGTPLKGSNGFSGGVTNDGYIYGSTTLTLDLRTQHASTFKFPGGTSITAGKPYNAGGSSYLQGGSDASMTLNIFANENSGDILEGAVVYGDGGSTAAIGSNTTNGHININIDAPNSTIGTLYATQYSNIASGVLRRNVNVNIQRIKSIGGISGGNSGDNINNTIAAASSAVDRLSTFNVGVPADATDPNPEYQSEPIQVSGIGIINFTSLLVDNGTTVTASSGNIKNGGSATAANHAATYSTFGDITLKNKAGLGVTGTNAFISGGKLTVTDENKIESGQGTGIINISDIEFVDADNSRLTWVKNNTVTTPSVTANGTWFGSQTAYQVLTFNGTNSSNIQNALKVTPFNFKGIEKATGKTFIGDNDVTGAANGYGIMIPGSVIDYVVKDPVVDGHGFIEHNVADVKQDNQPLTLKVWGTEVAGTKVQKGRLIIPSSSSILPTLTFTPETATTGSWLYNANIASTKVGSTDEVIGEQLNSDPVDWSSTDGSYSYEVEVRYSNEVELDARSIILTETEAATITKKDIEDYTEVDGRPFLESTIDAVLADIQAPLGADEYSRKTEVTYTAGTAAVNPTNSMTTTVNVIVVKDGSKVSADRHGAIYAEDAILRLQEVHDLNGDQIEFEKQYTNVRSFKSDGTTTADGTTSTDVTADASTYFDRLSALTDADVQDDSKVIYQLQYGTDASEVVSIEVSITVMPNTTTFIIKFVDEDGSELHAPITSTETIGSRVDLTANQDVKDAIAAVEALRYVLENRPGPDESAILIVNGGTTVEYQFKGVLALSAPDVIDFKTHAVTVNDTRVEDPELKKTDQSATKLTVFDNRATKTNWTLTAKLTGAMANTEDGTKILANAIKFNNGTTEEALTGAETEIKTHQHDSTGDYVVSDDWSNGGAGLKLEVPAGSVKKLGKYQAEITWILGDTP